MKVDTSYPFRGPMRRLGVVMEYCKEKGHRTQGTRVEYYQKILARFEKKPELNDDEAWALAELQELYVIVCGARKNECIAKELPRCIGGTHLLENEKATNSGNASRNASFELYIASKMVIFGLNVSIPPFGKNADINFFCSEQMVPIECKRLYAPGKISRILREACVQVSKRLEDGKYGIAAISLTREFWSSASGAVKTSIDEARQAVAQLYLSWQVEMVKALMDFPKIALIYIHIQLPCVGEEQVFHVYEREFFRTRVKYEELPEAPVVNEFIKMMTSDGITNVLASPD